MDSPLVSLCIPTYNRPDFLRRTIESALAQTYQNFEIIVTDNSTNDLSAKMVAEMADHRIHFYSNNGNIGATASCNRAVSIAQGKYLQLLMDDDLIKPQFLEAMVAAFENNPTAGVVMAPMEFIDESDKRIFPKFYFFRTMQYRYRYQVGDGLIDRKRVLRDYLTRDYPCCVPSGILYRAEALRQALPFDPEADFAGDVDACMKIAANWDFYYIDHVLSSWRYTPTCHTARLHSGGLKSEAFYYITRHCLENKNVQAMFKDEWDELVRGSLYFCSCRSMMLNGMAAIRACSPSLLLETFKTIRREDPHWSNLLRVPFFALREVFLSIFPPKMPPARESQKLPELTAALR